MRGFGDRKCRVAGIWRCCSASTTFSRLATPAAVSRWPRLGFTEPSPQKPVRAGRRRERLAQCGDLDRVADRRAGAVGLDVLHVVGRHLGQRQRLG
jgi:hypothetical protein